MLYKVHTDSYQVTGRNCHIQEGSAVNVLQQRASPLIEVCRPIRSRIERRGWLHTHTHTHTHSPQKKTTNMAEALWVLKKLLLLLLLLLLLFYETVVLFSVWSKFSQNVKNMNQLDFESTSVSHHEDGGCRRDGTFPVPRVLSHSTRLTHPPFQHSVEESQCADVLCLNIVLTDVFKLRKEISPDSQHRNRRTGFNPICLQTGPQLQCWVCAVNRIQRRRSITGHCFLLLSCFPGVFTFSLLYTSTALHIGNNIVLFTPLHLFELKLLYRSLCLWLNSDRRSDRCWFIVIYETEVVLWC